jgi:hypothetical protein
VGVAFIHGNASVKSFLLGRISGRQQQVESIYGRRTLSTDSMLESGSYKILSSPQLADCERVLVSLNIAIRDGFYSVRYPAVLPTAPYNFSILEKSLALLTKSQSSTR